MGMRSYTAQAPGRSDCDVDQTTHSLLMAMVSPETCVLILSKQIAIQVGG